MTEFERLVISALGIIIRAVCYRKVEDYRVEQWSALAHKWADGKEL